MKAKITVLIGLFLAVLASVGMWFAKPRIIHTPHGIFLPSKTYQPYHGTPSATVFIVDRFPPDYETLGTINVEQHYAGAHATTIQQQVLNFAKALAAKQGATAIVVTEAYFSQPKGPEKGLGSLHFSGKAIKVTQVDL